MRTDIEGLVRAFEERKLTRREVVAALMALAAARGSAAAGQPVQVPRVARASTLNHVSIGVSDVERSAGFYRSLVGPEVVSRPGNGGINLGTLVQLSANGYQG